LEKILEILEIRKKEYLFKTSEKINKEDSHKLTLDYYDEIFLTFLDEFIKNM